MGVRGTTTRAAKNSSWGGRPALSDPQRVNVEGEGGAGGAVARRDRHVAGLGDPEQTDRPSAVRQHHPIAGENGEAVRLHNVERARNVAAPDHPINADQGVEVARIVQVNVRPSDPGLSSTCWAAVIWALISA